MPQLLERFQLLERSLGGDPPKLYKVELRGGMNKKRQTGPVDYSSVDFDKLMASLGDVSYLIGDHIKETLTTLFEGFKRGVTPKQALNISPQSVEQLYTQAYTLYNQGNYKKAIILFQILMLI